MSPTMTPLLCILLLLTMVGGRCLASPWIEENGDSVSLRAQFCKPVSEDHLWRMLGEAFDPSKMITEDMAAARRANPSRLGHLTHDVEERSAVDPYYQAPNSERDLHEKLKNVYRKKAKKLAGKPLPWQCTLEEQWLRLKDGYFPTLLQEGKCTNDKCFFGLFNCKPQLYPIKILKRDPDYCNPLPYVSINTTYEQKWSIVRYFVTVGCTCGIKDQKTGQPR